MSDLVADPQERALPNLLRPLAGAVVAGFGVQLILVVSGVLAARLLGVEGRGHLALIVLFPAVLTQLGGLGLPLATTYYVARDNRSAWGVAHRIRSAAVVQAVALTAIDAAILYLVIPGDAPGVRTAAFLSLPAIAGTLAEQYGLALLQGQQRFRPFNILRILAVAIYSFGIALIFLIGSRDIAQITLAWTCAYVISGATTLWIARRGVQRPRRTDRVEIPSLAEMTRFGLRGLFGWVSPVEGLRADQQIVGLSLSSASLGIYVVAQSLTNLPRFIAQSIGMVSTPAVASNPDVKGARRVMWRYFWISLGVSAVLVLILELLAGWLVQLFYGQEFHGAVSAARLLLVAALLMGVRRTLADGARGLSYPGVGTAAEIVSWVTLIPLLPVLASRAGVNGVALALVISSLAALVALVLGIQQSSANPISLDRIPGAQRFRRPPSRRFAGDGFSLQSVAIPLACMAAGVGFAASMSFITTNLDYMIITAIGLIAVAPLVLNKLRGRLDVFEPTSIVAYAFLVLFVARPIYDIAVFHRKYLGIDLSGTYRLALIAALVSIIAVQVGYYMRLPVRLAKSLPAPPRDLAHDAVVVAALAFTIVGAAFVAAVAHSKGGLGALFSNRSVRQPEVAPFISEGFLVALPAVLLLFAVRARYRGVVRILALLPVSLILVLALPSGNRRYLLPLLAAVTAFYYLRRDKRPSLVIVVLAIFILLVGFIDPARNSRTGTVSYTSALAQSVRHPFRPFRNLLREGDTAMIDDVALEMKVVPSVIQYRHGVEFVNDTALSFIPRQAWPSKPRKIQSLVVEHYFGVSKSGGCATLCPTFSLVGEAYVDFGLWSVALISLLFGVLMRLAYAYFRLYSDHVLVQAAYAGSIWIVFHPWEDGFSIVTYSIVLLIGPIILAAKFAGRRRAQGAIDRSQLAISVAE